MIYSGGTPYHPSRGMPEQVWVVGHQEPRRTIVTLPPDDVGYGFTNVGEVLSLPTFLMEKYLAASRRVIDELVDGDDPSRRPKTNVGRVSNPSRRFPTRPI